MVNTRTINQNSMARLFYITSWFSYQLHYSLFSSDVLIGSAKHLIIDYHIGKVTVKNDVTST